MSPIVPHSKLPNSELVLQAVLGQWVPGLDSDHVAGDLPKDVSKWAGEVGFATTVALRTSSAEIDLPIFDPIIEVHTWGRNVDTNAPRWSAAWGLHALIAHAFEADNFGHYNDVIEIGGSYKAARVHTIYIVTEPTRVRGDASGFAHLSFDTAIHWTVVE